jgi:ankyrin repeat protein
MAFGGVAILSIVLLSWAWGRVIVAEKNIALLDAVDNGDATTLRALIAEGANVNARATSVGSNNQTARLIATAAGVDRHGSNIEAPDYNGRTALVSAAGRGDLECVRALIGAGAHVNDNESGYTPLMRASQTVNKGNLDCVRALIAAGANVNLAIDASPPPVTALTLAAEVGNLEVIKALVAAGARPNGWDIRKASDHPDVARVLEGVQPAK